MKDIKFLILGGDERSLCLGEYLEANGLAVCYYAFRSTTCFENTAEAVNTADCIILPLPFSRDRVTLNAPLFDETVAVSEIAALAAPGKVFFGGQLPKSFCEEVEARGAECFDYFTLDELAIYNAVPTAEGVIGILINELPCTVQNMKCAVTGYGKVGKILAAKLAALNCDVTVFARRETDRADAFAKNIKFENIGEYKKHSRDFDALINTVPTKVIGADELNCTRSGCVLIEIASPPYGIDFQAAKERAFDVIKAGSLPGKVAPKTAGEIIARTLIPIFKKKGLIA